jgi:ribosomal protein S18 acetylase RimI-like enzyme
LSTIEKGSLLVEKTQKIFAMFAQKKSLVEVLWRITLLIAVGQQCSAFTIDRLDSVPSRFVDSSTNIEYVHLGNYNDYSLYKLNVRSNATGTQISQMNTLLEKFLQESFETPCRSYADMLEYCGSTILASFLRNNTRPSLANITGLLMARLEAYVNAQYICYLSVSTRHRQKGLGTKLMQESINGAIRAKNSQVILHVNTANQNAVTLYQKCGMRCAIYLKGFYFGDQTYSTQDAFGMVLKLANVKNSAQICQSVSAVEVPSEEEDLSRQQCSAKKDFY